MPLSSGFCSTFIFTQGWVPSTLSISDHTPGSDPGPALRSVLTCGVNVLCSTLTEQTQGCPVLFCPYLCGSWIPSMCSEDALIDEVMQLSGSTMEGPFSLHSLLCLRERDQHERNWKSTDGKGRKEAAANMGGVRGRSCEQGSGTKPAWNTGDHCGWHLRYQSPQAYWIWFILINMW